MFVLGGVLRRSLLLFVCRFLLCSGFAVGLVFCFWLVLFGRGFPLSLYAVL